MHTKQEGGDLLVHSSAQYEEAKKNIIECTKRSSCFPWRMRSCELPCLQMRQVHRRQIYRVHRRQMHQVPVLDLVLVLVFVLEPVLHQVHRRQKHQVLVLEPVLEPVLELLLHLHAPWQGGLHALFQYPSGNRSKGPIPRVPPHSSPPLLKSGSQKEPKSSFP